MLEHLHSVLPRRRQMLLALAFLLPSLLAAAPGGSPRISGVDPVGNNTSPYHDVLVHPAKKVAKAPAPAGKQQPAPAPDPGPRRLAEVRGVELFSPSPEALAHGFHEGSSRSAELVPVGVAGDNPRGITLPKKAEDGVRYVVMPSRGRAAGPTSAVDVAIDEGVAVKSPVSGTVVDVSTYALYGRTNDVMMRIRPDSNPDVLVVIFHLVDPAVGAGDAVEAGETTVAASARPLPFASQVDRWAGKAGPHVHIQVDPAG